MTTKIAEVNSKWSGSFLELREFAAPHGEDGLQLTPMGAVYVQLDKEKAKELIAHLQRWVAEFEAPPPKPGTLAYRLMELSEDVKLCALRAQNVGK